MDIQLATFLGVAFLVGMKLGEIMHHILSDLYKSFDD